MPLLQHLCQLLNDSSFGTMIRESDYAYSVIESVHVLAITLVFGTIAILDLRMLGLVLRPIAVTRVARAVFPLTWSGFAISFISGFLLFWAEVGDPARNSLARSCRRHRFAYSLVRHHHRRARHRLFLICLEFLNCFERS